MLRLKNVLRILAGLCFLCIAWVHFDDAHRMAVYVPLPWGSVYFVYFSGLLIALASMGVIFNRYLKRSLMLIAIVFAFTAMVVQIPVTWRQEEILRLIGFSNLFKLGLACILLLITSGMLSENK